MSNADDSDESLMGRHARGPATLHGSLLKRYELRTWRYLELNVGNLSVAVALMQVVWSSVASEAPQYYP